MSSGKQPYSEEGYALMAAAFEVHNEIGGGVAEEIYQQSLEIELDLRGVSFRSRPEVAVFYKQRELKKRYIPDLVAYDKIVIELKSASVILPEHEGQLMNYMRISKSPVGYLINFGPIGKLEYKRFVLSGFLEEFRTADEH